MASIEKRGENTWRITVSTGYDITGKKLRKHKSIELDPKLTDKQREKKLQELAVEFEKQVQKGQVLDENMTFAEFTEIWLEQHAEKNLEPKTLYEYQLLLSERILPSLGHIKIGKLQPIHLLDFYDNLGEPGLRMDTKYTLKAECRDLLKDIKSAHKRTIQNIKAGGRTNRKTVTAICKELDISKDVLFTPVDDKKCLSSNTINHYHRCISSILQQAVYWQVIPYNPCERVKPPKVDKKEASYFDEDYVEKILELLENEPLKYKVMIHIAIFSGCRLGELSGLTWDSINLDESTITIKKAAQYVPDKGTYDKNPKSESGNRVVTLLFVVK